MKQYRFNNIKEDADKWGKGIPKDKHSLMGVPYRLFVFQLPIRDVYGEVIDDMSEWLKQREEYCEKLAKEYKNYCCN